MRKPKPVLVYEPSEGVSRHVIIINTSKKEPVALGPTRKVSLKNGVIIPPDFGSLAFVERKRTKKPIYAIAKRKASLGVVVTDRLGADLVTQAFALNS